MHRTALLFSAISFVLVAAAAFFLASRAVEYIETSTQESVDKALLASGQNWATTRADGLVVHLTGLAPDEAARLQALEIMGQVIDTGRISDRTTVLQSSDIVEPRFSIEVLRNLDRISLIGLIPERVGRSFILDRAATIVDGGTVTDMLESSEHRIPAGWATNLEFGLESLALLKRSKISITPEQVRVTAVTESPEEQSEVEQALLKSKPDGVVLIMDISAPRPVIAPFRFRIRISDDIVELQSCSSDTRASRDRILRSVRKAGGEQKLICDIGLGVPTTEWDQAIVQSVQTLAALGGGTLDVSDSDISLVATDSVSQSRFDTLVGSLENNLPDLFSLQAVLPPKNAVDGTQSASEEPEFIATRSPEGLIQLRGRIQSQQSKESIGAFAQALFGADAVDNNTRIDPNLPDGWPTRVLAGLEGLAELRHGAVVVQPEEVSIRGISAKPEITTIMSKLFAVRLGSGDGYKIDVQHDPKLIAKDNPLDARQCELQLNAVLGEQQIAFAPGSSTIEASSQGVLDAIADILRECPDTRFEIEGHTDSQGRDEMNLSLSQQRADAVLSGLLARRILITGLTAKGFGETQPLADNGTEEGRAANRRIAFRLITDDTPTTVSQEDTSDE
jgi:OOP family OmpA-OmpF porin